MTTTSSTTIQSPSLTSWDIHRDSVLNGGGTFNRFGGQPQKGFAVTVAVMDTMPFLSAQAIEAFRQHIDDENYLGTWLDTERGQWEISETVVYDDRDEALRVARLLGERYVYDLAANAEIATS